MQTEVNSTTLYTEAKGFNGIEFMIEEKVNGEVIKTASKTLNLLSALELVDNLRSHLKYASDIAHTLNYYDDYAQNIEKMLDDDEKTFEKGDDDNRYHMGCNMALFLNLKKNGGDGIMWADNHKASKIVRREFNKAFPGNKVEIDAEMSHCYISAKSREEASQFMTWANEKYYKPWVDAHRDGWEKFCEAYKSASQEQKELFSHLIYN